ncbi:hypothetical protein ACIBUR_03315 [Streptomyces anulatus]
MRRSIPVGRGPRRGQQDGELDSTVPAQWIQRMVWSIVYTGLHATGDGPSRATASMT